MLVGVSDNECVQNGGRCSCVRGAAWFSNVIKSGGFLLYQTEACTVLLYYFFVFEKKIDMLFGRHVVLHVSGRCRE
jgi:hypothetical protein